MEMVWCQSCKTVVWAYDHAEPSDRAGVANSFSLPCPLCGVKGNFNGKGITSQEDDKWSYMKWVATIEALTWNPSGDNHWFRPGTLVVYPQTTEVPSRGKTLEIKY